MKDFFKQLQVVEIASVLAGPSVGMFFSELGAKVIKIENKSGNGDISRSWKLAEEDPEHPFSAYYSSVNYGKESRFLDLKKSHDQEKIKALIKKADVLLVNFKKGDAEKFGLDFEKVKVLKPKIIYGEISGFGKQDRLAYDVVLQAESGFISMNGTADGDLCKLPVALIDLFAAHQLKEGILLAMLRQKDEQKALKVSVSLYDAAIASLANQASNWLMAKQIARPMGMLHPNIAPYGEMFACKDGKFIVLAVGSDRQFFSLCQQLGLEQMSHSKKFNSNQNRLKNREAMQNMLQKEFLRYPSSELMKTFIQNKIPAGLLRNIKEVFETESAQNLILKEKKENRNLTTVKGNVFTISH